MLAFMRDLDVVLCPVADDAAPPWDAPVPVGTWRYMLPFALTGQPVAVVPAARTEADLPIGVQLVARAWKDHVALAAAGAVEAALQP
jgi:amidase